MRKLLDTARAVAGASSSLLITGETGVGKEYLAQAIHAGGPRADVVFLVVNCGALPETLLESQLFGHVRGAFTGADRAHPGFFASAEGGTLLLDEIGEMPLHLQVKLLNVLDRHLVTPLGSSTPIPIDLRVMAATNHDLHREARDGRFRKDLLYRLSVVELRIPPLRERRDEIPDLAARLVRELWDSNPGRGVEGIDARAMDAMRRHSWPGNVRELRNVIERAIVLGRGEYITLDELPAEFRRGQPTLEGPEIPSTVAQEHWLDRPLSEIRAVAVAEVERVYLCKALASTRGHIGRTAVIAGLHTRSLYDKMKRHGLRKEDFRDAAPSRDAGEASGVGDCPGGASRQRRRQA